jgi:lipoprotein-anchoring transpeptidase ErfK/SrfK
VKNSQYLKKYVQLHLDNKMGWYLLGKDYESNGEQGKANYCFNQSSDVYEAFEHSKVPDDLWEEYQTRLLQLSQDGEQRSRRIRAILMCVIMILLIGIPSIEAPASSQSALSSSQEPGVDVVVEEEQLEGSEDTPSTSAEAKFIPSFTAQAAGSSQERARTLSDILSHPLPVNMVVLGMKRQDKWLLWKHDMPVAFTLVKNEAKEVTYRPYDPKECDCKPPDTSSLQADATAWIKKQEDTAVLSSGIKAFAIKNKRVPSHLNELVKAFPNNWISGTTVLMKQNFAKIAESIDSRGANKGQDSSASKGQQLPTLSANLGERPYFNEPLQIIVDKNNHRLAVVSGNVILRNYKVGLGGDKTPESDFVISDKVMNPNGSDRGEFGSRGMQLSASNYAIHGTDHPDSIGKDESNGCIRMARKDVEELFDLAPKGTKVHISKGVLPDDLLVPAERYATKHGQDQTNPMKIYHWLN